MAWGDALFDPGQGCAPARVTTPCQSPGKGGIVLVAAGAQTLTDPAQAAKQHKRTPGSYRRAARWHYLASCSAILLPPAVGRLGILDTSALGTCCFPILQSALVLCTPLQLKRSLSHRSLQGSAALGLLSRHGLGCCSSHTMSSPCWA